MMKNMNFRTFKDNFHFCEVCQVKKWQKLMLESTSSYLDEKYEEYFENEKEFRTRTLWYENSSNASTILISDSDVRDILIVIKKF